MVEISQAPDGIEINKFSPPKDLKSVLKDLGYDKNGKKEAITVVSCPSGPYNCLITIDLDDREFRNNHSFDINTLRSYCKSKISKIASRNDKCVPTELIEHPLFTYPGTIQAVKDTTKFMDDFFKPISYEPKNPFIRSIRSQPGSGPKAPQNPK